MQVMSSTHQILLLHIFLELKTVRFYFLKKQGGGSKPSQRCHPVAIRYPCKLVKATKATFPTFPSFPFPRRDLVAVGWTTWIGSSGSDVKMTFVPKFVQGVSAKDEVSRNMRISGISMQVRERRTKGARPESGGGNGRSRGKNVEAKRLTVRMKEAKSAEEFVNVLEQTVDGPISIISLHLLHITDWQCGKGGASCSQDARRIFW